MKKLHFILLVFVSASNLFAQISFSEGQSVLVYSLPQTKLCIEIQTEEITQTPGQYYQYAQRYLATNDVIVDKKTSYRLKDVAVKTTPIPDPNRTYAINAKKKSPLNHISVNALGLLCGINIPCEPTICNNRIESSSVVEKSNKMLLPLGEEYLMAGSTAKLAEGIAKQIYHIRESRIALLTADLDQLPADDTSLHTMLDELNNMERELTELFVGKKTVEIQKQTLFLTPDTLVDKKVLFRFSALKGVVSADDLTGSPYYISIFPEKIETVADSKNNQELNTSLHTLLPANTLVTISDGAKTQYSGIMPMSQFGVVLSVSQKILSPANKVYIDWQTGRLLRIE